MLMKEWNTEAVAIALRAETDICYHPSEGKGHLFLVGLSHTKLSVWPQTGHVAILSPSLTFDAYRMRLCSIGERDVLFEGGRKGNYRHLVVNADGSVVFHIPGSPDRSYETTALRPKTNSLRGGDVEV